jgi:hypothetical protein
MSHIMKKFSKIPALFVVGLLFALILASACTDTSQPPVSPTSGKTPGVPEVPVTPGTSGIPGTSIISETPTATITSGNPSCPSGQTLCDGSCIDTQSNSKHCGKCGNACNESEPCSEGTCLSWAGSWVQDGWIFYLTQTGTSVNGTDTFKHKFSGSTSGNPPRLTCTWVIGIKEPISTPCTFDMARTGNRSTAVCSDVITSPIPGNRTDLVSEAACPE